MDNSAKIPQKSALGSGATLTRRSAAAALALPALLGCGPRAPVSPAGGYAQEAQLRGHGLREGIAAPENAVDRRAELVVVGGGVAGMAAARELAQAGRDVALLELQDAAGGNARSHAVAGLACPAGAHYLPVPDARAPEVQRLLAELGLAEFGAGGFALTPLGQRQLCHAPQERAWHQGVWHEGLLPLQSAAPGALAQIKSFAARVEQLRASGGFRLPVLQGLLARSRRSPQQVFLKPNDPVVHSFKAFDAIVFDEWLSAEGFTDPLLRHYLDYCCRDDYGAGLSTVSAWAGLHYFASRHGFSAPGVERGGDAEGLLTWAQGNGWLVDRLAQGLGQRVHAQRLVRSVSELRGPRGGVEVLAQCWRADGSSGWERWRCDRCIVATPLRVAARIVQPAPDALKQLAARVPLSAWVVVNAAIAEPLHEPQGTLPAAWDNVVFGSSALGYVDAGHQALSAAPASNGPRVLTHYRALGAAPGTAQQLLQSPWTQWRDAMLQDLAEPHPDLAAKMTRVEVIRYGHAMAVPSVGTAALAHSGALAELGQGGFSARVAYAHSDLAGYSVFEEAYTAGRLVARRWA